MSPESLPIDEVLPLLRATLGANRNAVLSAPPGAGKTTRVPPALLAGEWMTGRRIVMLEPRRLAARRAASFMARERGERAGDTVGFRTRGETAVGPRTRIEVVTEGVLTRMLQTTPDLPGVGALVFDEFHERSIHADLGLALALDVQEHLRPELRILVMSATLDTEAVSAVLGGAPVVRSSGRAHPVETRYAAEPQRDTAERASAAAVRRALRDAPGDLLVFLPGRREIRRTAELLALDPPGENVRVCTLYGEAPPGVQEAALAGPAEGVRKVILATSIAETSLTIDGVRTVIDCGLARVPRFDPRRGMGTLATVAVSRATADQRRGRAGRQAPGVCYRLWTEGAEKELPSHPTPEILAADLAPLALELAAWGAPDGGRLRFIDPPPPAHLEQARGLLRMLGALDARGQITPHGRAMAVLPIHPRLGHMLERSRAPLACDVAALLDDQDLLRGERGTDVEISSRLHALEQGGPGVDETARARILAHSRRLRTLIHAAPPGKRAEAGTGPLLALAYPDRVARRRAPGSRRYILSGGTGAILPERSPLAREEGLALGELEGSGTEARDLQAAQISEGHVRELFGDVIETREEVRWDGATESVRAAASDMLGALVIAERPHPSDDPRIPAVLLTAIRDRGIEHLPWPESAADLLARSEWLRSSGHAPAAWPDLGWPALAASAEAWLTPFLAGVTRRSQLPRVDLHAALRTLFTRQQLRALDELAPVHLQTPAGTHVRLEYSAGNPPVLSVRLQEMFGQTETPAVAGGRVAVRIHLLSPAGRPLAVTQNLVTFWREAYPEVRKEMRGRYPKHVWPENPLAANPTRRAGAAGRREAGTA